MRLTCAKGLTKGREGEGGFIEGNRGDLLRGFNKGKKGKFIKGKKGKGGFIKGNRGDLLRRKRGKGIFEGKRGD